jgi:hypothetical protein
MWLPVPLCEQSRDLAEIDAGFERTGRGGCRGCSGLYLQVSFAVERPVHFRFRGPVVSIEPAKRQKPDLRLCSIVRLPFHSKPPSSPGNVNFFAP